MRDNRGFHLRNSVDSELFDLCQQCYDGLAKWMKEIKEPFGPCDLCRFNPPSSADGKPCTMCPAEKGEPE